MRIAVDVMGGGLGASEIVPAVQRSRDAFSETQYTLFGKRDEIVPFLRSPDDFLIVDTEDVVRMDDKPAFALRRRQASSMYRAIEAVSSGDADGCVSPGNTGALMAIARHVLKTLPGVDRPAIIKAIPSNEGRCYLLDLGANINCTAEQLVQFAVMGSLMCGAVENIRSPRVALLNIGEEEVKGEGAVREAAEVLKQIPEINFIGFVEGDGIYQSEADVLVCDGWVGNVALKTSEGLARYVSQIIGDTFRQHPESLPAAAEALRQLRNTLSPENYNGATLLGLSGIVVKSHGSANENGFFHAIEETRRCIEQGVPNLLGAKIARLTGE